MAQSSMSPLSAHVNIRMIKSGENIEKPKAKGESVRFVDPESSDDKVWGLFYFQIFTDLLWLQPKTGNKLITEQTFMGNTAIDFYF